MATDALDLVRSYVAYPLRAQSRRARTFSLDESSYPYFVHHYNRAWRNERTVDLALDAAYSGVATTHSVTTASTRPNVTHHLRAVVTVVRGAACRSLHVSQSPW